MKMAGLKIMEQFEISEEQSGFVEWGDLYGKNQMSELLSKGSAASHGCNDSCWKLSGFRERFLITLF